MRITVKVKANLKEERVIKIGEHVFEVTVHAPAAEGKANVAVVKVLAEYFGIAPSRIHLVLGRASREKLFEVI